WRDPFRADGGLRVIRGNLGRGVIKLSAVQPEHWQVTAPCRVFDSQQAFVAAFENNEFRQDMIAVVRFQGPAANGMPELHKLTPYLGVLQERGYRVALVTDGRMSGASGKVPAAIQLYPEAGEGGPLARLRDGDVIRVDGNNGRVEVLISYAEWQARVPAPAPQGLSIGSGRELFAFMRAAFSCAEQGASVFSAELEQLR